MPDKLYADASVFSPAPVTPEQRLIPNGEWMQQHTDLARFRGGIAIPLTLLAQRTGTTTVHTGSIDHAQAPIGFSAVFMRQERAPGRTAQRPIGLEGKVSSGEATRFEGGGGGRWTIPRSRSGWGCTCGGL